MTNDIAPVEENLMKTKIELRYLLVTALCILYSGHALAASSNYYYSRSLYFLWLFGIVLIFLSLNRKKLLIFDEKNKSNLVILGVWGGIVLINLIAHISTDTITSYLIWFSYALFAFSIYFFVGEEIFCETFVKIMVVLCVISLLFFFIIQKTPLFNVFGYMNGSSSEASFQKYHGFLAYYCLDPLRNSGPFWEPGIFASQITFAVIIHFAKSAKPNLWYVVIFLITMLTTRSAAGYVLILFLMLFYLIRNNASGKADYKSVLLSVFTISFSLAVLYLYFNFENVAESLGLSDNLNVKKLLAVSENSRSASLEWCFERFSEKPLFGYGAQGFADLAADLGVRATTTTSTRLMAMLGMGGICYTVFLVRGIARQTHLTIVSKALLLFILLLVINKEGHDSFILTWVLIFILNGNREFFTAKEKTAKTIFSHAKGTK